MALGKLSELGTALWALRGVGKGQKRYSVLESQVFLCFPCLVPSEGGGEGICQQLGPDLTLRGTRNLTSGVSLLLTHW